MANYYDTEFTYIKPVRHFKANDPYYYEVDNIPIKQLEENTNFLKDQVDGLLTEGAENESIEIGRKGFSELKPFVNGDDRVVRVKPGRYTARINNAYDITAAQVVNQVLGLTNIGATDESINTWRTETNKGTYVSGITETLANGDTGDVLGLNGLLERAFVYPIDTEDGESAGQNDFLNVTTPGYSEFDGVLSPDNRPLYPNVVGALYKHNSVDTTRDLKLIQNLFDGGSTAFGGQQGRVESDFIKRWRGAIRTSIVDVPEELSIELPSFDENDFFFINESGNTETVEANHRIDLVFIYSKGVDEESTTINKFVNDNPQSLTQPVLGIIKGAGIGVNRQTSLNNVNADDRVNLTNTLDGTPLMLAHPGDENGANIGFSTSAGVIRGSFPSPDDLMNLAPVLSENLESTALPLIGQTILPVAYIRVRKQQVGAGADIVTADDVIDIRPFFRTTELAYNERAGIAAATPQVSLANPVVSEAHLEKVRAEIYADLNSRIGEGGTPSAPPPPTSNSRVLATGLIAGGFNYGPEGALSRQRGWNGDSLAELRASVQTEFGYYNGSIEFEPSWDKGSWYQRNGFQGNQPCDYINVGSTQIITHGNPNAFRLPPWNGPAPGSVEGARTEDDYNGNLGSMGFGKTLRMEEGNLGNYSNEEYVRSKYNEIFYVSKLIRIVNNPFSNYHVNVNYLNCVPLTTLSIQNQGALQLGRAAQPAGIWVVKHPNYFIINVAWPNDGLFAHPFTSTEMEYENRGKPWLSRNSARDFCGFMLPGFDAGNAPQSNDYQWFDPVIQYDKIKGYGGGPNDGGIASNTFNSAFDRSKRSESGSNRSQPNYYSAITPILYPSVTFEIVGYDDGLYSKALGADGTNLSQNKFGQSLIDLA